MSCTTASASASVPAGTRGPSSAAIASSSRAACRDSSENSRGTMRSTRIGWADVSGGASTPRPNTAVIAPAHRPQPWIVMAPPLAVQVPFTLFQKLPAPPGRLVEQGAQVVFRRTEVGDRDAQRRAARDDRGGQEERALRHQPVHDATVQPVEPGVVEDGGAGPVAEVH